MTRPLPEDKKIGFWGKIKRSLESIFLPQKYIADTQAINTKIIVNNQVEMEEKRQQIKLAELKLQYIENQENRDFQAQQAELNHQRQKELQEYIQSVNLAIHQGNLEFQRWRFEQEKSLQTELAQYNRETQLFIAEYQRETAIKVAHNQAEVQKIFANWPLTLPPAQILES
jgi:hypothetical protein